MALLSQSSRSTRACAVAASGECISIERSRPPKAAGSVSICAARPGLIRFTVHASDHGLEFADTRIAGHPLLIAAVSSGPLLGWNTVYPDTSVGRGDVLIQMDRVMGDAVELVSYLKAHVDMVIEFVIRRKALDTPRTPRTKAMGFGVERTLPSALSPRLVNPRLSALFGSGGGGAEVPGAVACAGIGVGAGGRPAGRHAATAAHPPLLPPDGTLPNCAPGDPVLPVRCASEGSASRVLTILL
eukprot:NODE_15589_length_1042_cov_2.285246.p1 GENE.NODE_15589_length_1042_cov_2.285246~~NODE_15589_length_1042_cov_2.285246.p1  ORF type:complete len:243 (-),score=28.19 NODE_15589_length_1042_cov_2.285246:252-980(-)